MTMTEPYSGLQVDSQHQHPKYFSPNQHGGEANPGFAVHTYSDKIASEEQPYPEVAHPYPQYPQQRERKRICGLAARTFWIVAAIVAIIVVAAGVGGGVGASLAGKNDSTISTSALTSMQVAPAASTSLASSAPLSSSASSTSLSTSASSTSQSISSTGTITPLVAPITSTPPSTTSLDLISTSTTIGPSETLLVDCPSSNNTLYLAPGTSQTFQKICSNSLTSIGVNLNAVQLFTTSLDGCIAACAAYNVQNASEIAGGESNVCNTVCWRATITGDDYPGVCFGFTTASTSASFSYGGDDRCDSAALISQSS